MVMDSLGWCLGFALVAVGIAPPIGAQAASELSPQQLADVNAGRQVFLTWDVAGSPWPRACVFQMVNATPEDAAAVFTNYARQTAYIPGLRKAHVSRVIDPVTAEVDYTLDVPIVADEDYTVRDHLSTYDSGASYRIEWTLVRATSTKATEGNVRFEPHRAASPSRDGTLMAYCNLVTPGSSLAKFGFIKSRALGQVRQSAAPIAVEIERQRADDRTLLAAELGALRIALLPRLRDTR